MEKRLGLINYGPHLWTRELAREIRGVLEGILREQDAGDTTVIDTKGVEVCDYSFANELFGKSLLSLATEYPGRFLIVENMTTYFRENLAKALESLNLAIIERKSNKLSLIGKVHPSDRQTFEAIVRAKKPVAAAALADQLEVNLTAMNERLTKLTGLALVRREKVASPAGREQYQYTVLA